VHVKEMCRREGSVINVETESCRREVMKEYKRKKWEVQEWEERQ
jgi:KaiC/GvpD/RAD55 family RecA-like ATPase